ncbi:TonB-dependent receptor domain-containing protein [Ferrimonas marina]|uniref:TonB-dependent Receptor Plug Domain n=1 Tax=Ferrimonas marina TaxID=299255 RepID=A0A1M5Z5I4_9GAMM|nr:TonB-dependent receptor [Ferrimonas marina]SHI19479.1 TonB-dependent Receptor Plug Domain [Ferrimonas marina]
MFNKNKLYLAMQFALVAGATTLATPTWAEEEGDEPIERVTVTGSRIASEGAMASTPVTVISAEALLSTGAINIGEALNELPALANTFSLANSGNFIGTAGLNILDLRNMGTSRTLVLVDGKRHVSSSPGSASVDINTIPTEWVESVEIITGGASAVYGADAVTGVVNFRLKKRITGFNANATAGWSEEGGYNNQRFSLSYGADFAGDRGNAAISVEHARQSDLKMLEREQTAVSWTSFNNGPDDDTIISMVPNAGYWGITNAGVIGVWDPVGAFGPQTFNADGSVRPVDLGANPNGLKCEGPCDYINLRQWEELQPEFDRTTANFKVNYRLTDDLNSYFQAKWSETNATTEGQPAFFFGSIVLGRDNAYIGDDLGQLMDDAGAPYMVMSRFMSDLGPRIEEDERDTQRYVLGLEGVVFEDWDLDAYALYGQTKLTRSNLNNLIYDNFFYSIDAVDDGNGNIVCRDAEAQANGCVPTSLFGDGAVNAEAADYFSTTSVGTAKIEQYVAGASIANPSLVELWAGDLGTAFGVEYRKEKSATEEDPFASEGNTFFNAFQNETGDFDVSEVFAEASLPLLTDLPLIDELKLDGAVRFADYSTVGNATSWTVRLDWQFYSDLRLRSSVATALRAPNIGEYYGAESQNFFNVDDNCRASRLAELSGEQRAIREANCAALGIPADFDSDYDSATLPGVNGGNQELEPEESDSFTVGLVFTPGFLEGFSATVDYWDIEITDAISGIGGQNIIDRCIDSPTGVDNQYCALIERDPDNYEITKITNTIQNVAKQEASGVDFEFNYAFPLLGGDLNANLLGTYLIERNEYPFQDDLSNFEEFAGTTGEAEWQGIFRLDYTLEHWRVSWKTRYLSDVNLYTPQFEDNFDKPYSNFMSYGSYAVSDAFVEYKFDFGLDVGLGIDNLFDRDLPGLTTGTGQDSASYDNIGRFYYVNLAYSF